MAKIGWIIWKNVMMNMTRIRLAGGFFFSVQFFAARFFFFFVPFFCAVFFFRAIFFFFVQCIYTSSVYKIFDYFESGVFSLID